MFKLNKREIIESIEISSEHTSLELTKASIVGFDFCKTASSKTLSVQHDLGVFETNNPTLIEAILKMKNQT